MQKFAFFTPESLSTLNDLSMDHQTNMLRHLSLGKIVYRNKHSYFNIILILSGDINLNPGPATVNNHNRHGSKSTWRWYCMLRKTASFV